MKKLICLFIILTITSCEKDEDISPIVGTWRVTAYETRQGSGSWQSTGEACRLDDTEEYNANGRWAKYEGANQCVIGTGITRGTWRLTAANTRIVYTYDDYAGEYESTVEQLTSGSLIISWSAGNQAGTQFRVRFTKIE